MFFVPETFFGFVQHVLVFRLSNDVFEQQPVFGDVLENNRKFAGVEKRCKFRPGLVGDLSGAESAAESLVSLRVSGLRCSNLQFPPFWTFLQVIRAPCLNVCQFGHHFAPLLSHMTLLDSGASATVLAESCMQAFGIDEPLDVGMPNFKTANVWDLVCVGLPVCRFPC